MDALERATRLHQEADLLMQVYHLQHYLGSGGEIFFSGSYYLDLMVYPDLDLYIPKIAIPSIFHAAGQVAANQQVIRVSFENEEHPGLEGGLYLNFRIMHGDWGRHWKVDVWWLERDMILQKMEIMQHFRAGITPELRLLILEYKSSLLNELGRTPMYSGYYIYKAFIDEGYRDFTQVDQYLQNHGIKLA